MAENTINHLDLARLIKEEPLLHKLDATLLDRLLLLETQLSISL